MQDEPSYLTGLAMDVIEHGGCEFCKTNAAMGLDKLGLLDEFLDRAGVSDPRPKSGPFSPEHAPPPAPTPREPAETFTLSVTFSLPSETSRESARRKLNDVMEAVKAAVVAQNGVVESLSV